MFSDVQKVKLNLCYKQILIPDLFRTRLSLFTIAQTKHKLCRAYLSSHQRMTSRKLASRFQTTQILLQAMTFRSTDLMCLKPALTRHCSEYHEIEPGTPGYEPKLYFVANTYLGFERLKYSVSHRRINTQQSQIRSLNIKSTRDIIAKTKKRNYSRPPK